MLFRSTSSTELRSNTKAERLTGQQNMSELYRICLDFKEFNTHLEFPQQTQFTTIDDFLHTLKNKVVVALDISSAFFIIPIKEEDRHKTAFWVNEFAYEFQSLVMGLKSAPYHLYKFLEIAFSQEIFKKVWKQLSEQEQQLAPESFLQCIKYYFDDFIVFADNYDQLLVCFKLVLLAARHAKIKFSIEKSTFFATKIKILGYSFDTKEIIFTMDKIGRAHV